MDETVSEAVVDLVDGTCIQNKESEFSLNPDSSGALESNEMVPPGVDDYPENFKNLAADIPNVKNLERIGSSGHASASPHCVDDAGIMVEELTLRNYDGEKLAIVGTSNSREKLLTRRNQWQQFYPVASEAGISILRGRSGHKEKGRTTSHAWEDRDKSLFCDLLDQKQPLRNRNYSTFTNNGLSNDNKGALNDTLYTSGATQAKFLSKSGFSEYLKSTMRVKGIIDCRGSSTKTGEQDHHLSGVGNLTAARLGSMAVGDSHLSHGFSEPLNHFNSSVDGISLRDWLETGQNKVNKVESMYIFKQVLELVDRAHSNGAFVQDLRPSCFKLLDSYQVLYVGSSILAGTNQVIHQSRYIRNEKRSIRPIKHTLDGPSVKKRKLDENLNYIRRWPQFPSRSASRNVLLADNAVSTDPSNDFDEESTPMTESNDKGKFSGHAVLTPSQQLQASVSCMLEEKWYTSPELLNEKGGSFASNIYSLGVLLFELHCSFDFGRSHAAAMLDLRHRILPPSFFSENPKEAGFCLWLLHPEPLSRPTTKEILQSEFMNGIQGLTGGESLSSIDKEEGKSELLLYFLSSLDEIKQKGASNLLEQIKHIDADIEEIEKRRPKKFPVHSSSPEEALDARGSSNIHGNNPSLDICNIETRLINNINQLENAYFSMRSNIQLSDGDVATQRHGELLKSRENWCTAEKNKDNYDTTDRLGGFFDGLCKYARYSKFKVRGIMRNGEYFSSPNVICSLSFDRDEDYLAAGGVSKKIKIFGFQSFFDDNIDIHYPVLEMANKSKLSCICWNSYISNYLASTDYDGVVKLWDATTGQGFCHFSEHSERAWSVDFSRVDPLKLASGSDDRLVKIWNINEKSSLATIKNHANVCCVQFSSDSAHLLAFSSADYRTYCYDLRNVSTPWCILAGHEKAVSYTKFLDAGTIVSASTDNTLKIWDLNNTSSNSVSKNACVLTLRGHTNEKNFVGLSVADGYITCGSETNEVFAYYKSLPMPITSHKFGSIDQITGKETEDSNGQFVSSVCWRRKSNMVVAANSSGCIKLLQMV